MASAMQASPTTCTLLINCDSNVVGFIGHHPRSDARPASAAICPGACGGMMLATATGCAAWLVYKVMLEGSTRTTAPSWVGGIHSIMPG